MGQHQPGSLRLCAFLLGAALFLFGGPAQAARLLEIRVERDDGELVLKGLTSDDAQMDPGVVWSYLRDAALEPVGDLPTDPDDPTRATLTGNIRIAILHGDRPAGSRGLARTDVVVQELRLTRASPADDSWQLAAGEVERTAQAAGIELPRPRWWLLAAVGGAGAVLLAALVVWWAGRHRPAEVNPAGPDGDRA